jgi:hypothetical protein
MGFVLRMLILNYKDSGKLFDNAYRAMDAKQSFAVIATGWRATVLRRGKPLSNLFFPTRQKESRRMLILKYGSYGMLTPAFWGILNGASLRKWSVTWDESNTEFLRIVFLSQEENEPSAR